MTITLGMRVRDVITGFSGIATGRVQYLTGCEQILINPGHLGSDGKLLDSNWFDIDRVEQTGPVLQLPRHTTNGFDAPAPTRT